MMINNDIIISYHKDRYNNYIEERINRKDLSISERDQRRKVSYIIRKINEKKIEEDNYNRTHVCQFCFMIKSRSGTCGCQE